MKKLLLIATVIAGTLGAGTMASAGDYRHGHGTHVAPAAKLLYHYFHPRYQIARHYGHRYHPRRHHVRRHLRHNRWAHRDYRGHRAHRRHFVDRRARHSRRHR